MQLLPHQIKAAKQITKKLKERKICLLSGEPRSGKSLSFLKVLATYKNPLVITQKNAMQDITKAALHIKTLSAKLRIVNYHQMLKENIVNSKYDIIVLDEAHRWVTGYPKTSSIWKAIKPFCKGVPMVFSSGTLTPEGYAGLFHMLALSDHTPWKRYKKFTDWFNDFGKPYSIRINGFDVKKYDRTESSRIIKSIDSFTVRITRAEAGHKHEAVDDKVFIELGKKQQKFYKKLESDRVYPKYELLADTPAKMIQKLHQISGGFVKNEDGDLITIKNNPKIKWLQDNIDPTNTIILANYIAEQDALAKIFPNTGSITKNCEGVDFSHFKTMVIYSMSFSAATYQQVRARQMNINRQEPIKIIYLISGIDNYVYAAVEQKKAFTTTWYKRNKDGLLSQ